MGKKELCKIAVDAMGGDAPEEIIKGAIDAVRESEDIFCYLVGKEDYIKEVISQYAFDKDRVEIIDAKEEISCDESPVMAIKKKKDSSMVVALSMVKEKKADAFISAGSSGAILVGGQFIVGRIKGIERSPLATLMPTIKGATLILDVGANVDARSNHLVQFAQIGSLYMKHIMKVDNPKVAIVNIGTEEAKGNALVKETYPLLKDCADINFVGSIEARDIHQGDVDVIVAEAFVGNVILKLSEGLSKTMVGVVKEGLTSNLKSKIGAALALPSLKKTLKKFDASEYGGAPLLGLNGLVVKVHGSAKAKEMKNAMFQCVSFKEEKMNEKMMEFLN
ncbi:MAG: phosphate acyltransferase PlsX [Lachnospiraceae bacterium]|nr:phosphate acyltransferase PlsX [Lachnospiraceae bacterium]